MRRIFMAGIGTDVGKTVLSAILLEALEADYWKPIQAGDLQNSDTLTIKGLVSNPTTVFHPESYRLSYPMSPHAAAQIDGITIDINQIRVPETKNSLIIEGAGGLLVPLNSQDLLIDLLPKLAAEIILISKNYLGSINHSLLSIEALRSRKLNLLGIIFNGPSNPDTEKFILQYSGLKMLGRVKEEPSITQTVIQKYAQQFKFI